MPTLLEVANMAKVSKSTASKALNNSREISEKTKKRIIDIAKDMGYVPNETAQILAGKKTKTIGLVINEIDSNYYNDVVGAIERKLKENDYSLLISLTGFDIDNQIHYIKLLLQKRVDGMIIKINNSKSFSERLEKIKNLSDIPVVLIGKQIPSLGFNVIENDSEYAMKIAISHLVSLGHKKIFFIGDKISGIRKAMFAKTMKEYGLKSNTDNIKEGIERFELGGYLRMKDILEKKKRGDFAVVAHYDSMANGAIKAIDEYGLKIPEDISIIGFDNIQESEYYSTPLTTVEFPNCEVGSMAAQTLFQEIENPKDSFKKHIILKPKIVIRKSTGPKNDSIDQ